MMASWIVRMWIDTERGRNKNKLAKPKDKQMKRLKCKEKQNIQSDNKPLTGGIGKIKRKQFKNKFRIKTIDGSVL